MSVGIATLGQPRLVTKRQLPHVASARTPMCRGCRTQGRRPLVVVSFREDSLDTVSLPLDYYKCLSLNKSASRVAVRQAYERTLSSPPDVGYSQEALFARAVLLKDAADCLQDVELRKAYDQNLKEAERGVPVNKADLPGALALLQECGQYEQVLSMSNQWLQANPDALEAADVAAAKALAMCDKAAQALQEDSSQVMTVCQTLEGAQQLLIQYQLKSPLQQQIAQTLDELAPQYCVELLALDMDAQHRSLRSKGLQILFKLLWDVEDHPLVKANREDFIDTARTHMTAAEQVSLYLDRPADARVTAKEMLDTATALVAVGLVNRQPKMVQKADAIIEQVASRAQQAAAAAGSDSAAGAAAALVDVSLEQAVCALLLGSPDTAQQLLGLDPETPAPVDEDVRAFVLDNSPSSDDLLPGVCALSESWLREAVLAGFRDTAGQDVSLNDWFSSPWVRTYLQVARATRTFSLSSAATMVVAAAASYLYFLQAQLGAFVKTVLNRSSRTVIPNATATAAEPESAADMAPTPKVQAQAQAAASASRRPIRQQLNLGTTETSSLETRGRLGGRSPEPAGGAGQVAISGVGPSALQERQARTIAGAAAGSTSKQARQAVMQGIRDSLNTAERLDFDRSKLEQEMLTVQQLKSRLHSDPELSAGVAVEEAAAEPYREVDAGRLRLPQDNKQHTSTSEELDEVTDQDGGPFAGTSFKDKRANAMQRLQDLEMQMWDSYQDDEKSPGGLARVVKLAVIAAAAVGVALTVRSRWDRQTLAPAAVVAMTAEAPSLSSIERVINNWMAVKSAALGSNHETSKLQQVLSGTALQKWRNLAEKDIQAGRHRHFVIHALKVDKVTPQRAGPGILDDVIVEVSVEEEGSLMNGALVEDSYNGQYRMRYRLERPLQKNGQKGEWTIVSSDKLK